MNRYIVTNKEVTRLITVVSDLLHKPHRALEEAFVEHEGYEDIVINSAERAEESLENKVTKISQDILGEEYSATVRFNFSFPVTDISLMENGTRVLSLSINRETDDIIIVDHEGGDEEFSLEDVVSTPMESHSPEESLLSEALEGVDNDFDDSIDFLEADEAGDDELDTHDKALAGLEANDYQVSDGGDFEVSSVLARLHEGLTALEKDGYIPSYEIEFTNADEGVIDIHGYFWRDKGVALIVDDNDSVEDLSDKYSVIGFDSSHDDNDYIREVLDRVVFAIGGDNDTEGSEKDTDGEAIGFELDEASVDEALGLKVGEADAPIDIEPEVETETEVEEDAEAEETPEAEIEPEAEAEAATGEDGAPEVEAETETVTASETEADEVDEDYRREPRLQLEDAIILKFVSAGIPAPATHAEASDDQEVEVIDIVDFLWKDQKAVGYVDVDERLDDDSNVLRKLRDNGYHITIFSPDNTEEDVDNKIAELAECINNYRQEPVTVEQTQEPEEEKKEKKGFFKSLFG